MKWVGAKIECDICTHQWWAVFLSDCDKLECPNCHILTNYEICAIAKM